MDVVICHGIMGFILVDRYCTESHRECKWVQVVHTYAALAVKGEKKYQAEVELCQEADQVVAIGPKLASTYSRCFGKGKVLVLTRASFQSFVT